MPTYGLNNEKEMLSNFIRQRGLRQASLLIAEEYFGFLVRSLPGYEGIIVRRAVYKSLFRKIGCSSLIYANAHLCYCQNITAGDYLAINSGAYIDGLGGIEFGNHVLVGPNAFVGSSNHTVSSSVDNPRIFMGRTPKAVRIGSNVWIGANAVICPGATIGDNSIVGAGSVVTGIVADSVLVGGNPAQIIKRF